MTSSIVKMEESVFGVDYSAKDLIVYALAIGMGSSEDDVEKELKFLYEKHPAFRPVPTFCLSLTFWACKVNGSKATCDSLPSFPPPLMAEESVIPHKFLRTHDDLTSFPVIHTWQCIVWDQSLPAPALDQSSSGRCDGVVRTTIESQTVSVVPKSIGTFVTSESTVFAMNNNDSISNNSHKKRVCTMQSTALVLGISEENVISYDSWKLETKSKLKISKEKPTIFEWKYQTVPSQALLYRLASGDSNKIHVDDSASKMLGSENKKPLLHGLFTLAVAFRAFSKLVDSAEERIKRLEGKFSQPAFVGDELHVKIWLNTPSPPGPLLSETFRFTILNPKTGTTLVDSGFAEFRSVRSKL